MQLYTHLPCPALVTDREGRIRSINQTLIELIGGDEMSWVGETMDGMFALASRIFMQSYVWPTLMQEDHVQEIQLQILGRDQLNVPVFVTCKKSEKEFEDAFVWVFFVSLERSRYEDQLLKARDRAEEMAQTLAKNEERLRLLDALNEETRKVRDPDTILPVALSLLGRHLGASRCAFAHVDADGEWFEIPHDYTNGCASTRGRYQLSLFGHRAVRELSAGGTFVVRDVESEIGENEGAAMFKAIGVKAIVCCAFAPGGAFRAMMAVHQTTPRDWAPDEVETVQEFVGRCWLLIEQRRAEASLRRSEALLRLANHAGDIGEWSVDPGSGELVISKAAAAMFELSDGASPTFLEILEHFLPEHRETMQFNIEECLRCGTSFDVEVELLTQNRRRNWVRAFGMAETGEDGRVTWFQGAFQNISAQKASVIALKESHEALRVTLKSIGDAVITTNPSGAVEWMNPVAEVLTGWSAAEAAGQSLVDVFKVVDGETMVPVEDPIATCLGRAAERGPTQQSLLLSRKGDQFGIEESAAPIRDDEGRVLGVVFVFRDVTEERRLAGEMSYRATHDDLTDLFNRAEFESRLDRLLKKSKEDSSQHAMLFVDLDQFKIVNDTCGHSIGDQALQQVSKLLLEAVRSRDTVARVGGDEFGILLEHCALAKAQEIAQQICDRMETFRFQHGVQRFRLGTSIGLVPIDSDWSSKSALMQAADTSCYAAKEAGRNRVHTWLDTDAGLAARKGQMQWTHRIEKALDDNSFVLFAQKIESFADGPGALRAEVLLRMIDSDGSLIPPGAFLPAAERYHLITRVDRWVLSKTTEWLCGLEDISEIDTISVNLSGKSVGDRSFHAFANRLLKSLDPKICQRICLEITETAAVTNFADATQFIDHVRRLGVRIALDDFGAGASSFGYLKNLSVDYLKIDGQFIQNLIEAPLDDVAVRCFVDVAKVVNVKTVAEFVDRQDVFERVRELGIDYCQGYLLHRPEPLEDVLSTGRGFSSSAMGPKRDSTGVKN